MSGPYPVRPVPMIERFPITSGRADALLYAVGYVDGRVKFGMTKTPRCRLRALCLSAPAAWVHVFGPVKVQANSGAPCLAERKVWSAAKKFGASRIGRTEYFTGLSRSDAMQVGRRGRHEAA